MDFNSRLVLFILFFFFLISPVVKHVQSHKTSLDSQLCKSSKTPGYVLITFKCSNNKKKDARFQISWKDLDKEDMTAVWSVFTDFRRDTQKERESLRGFSRLSDISRQQNTILEFIFPFKKIKLYIIWHTCEEHVLNWHDFPVWDHLKVPGLSANELTELSVHSFMLVLSW